MVGAPFDYSKVCSKLLFRNVIGVSVDMYPDDFPDNPHPRLWLVNKVAFNPIHHRYQNQNMSNLYNWKSHGVQP